MKLKLFACLGLLFLVTSLGLAQQSPSRAPQRDAAHSSGSLVDWPQFHFDSGLTGYNPYETILSPSNVGNVTLKWSYAPAEGRVEGQPAVVNDVMYFASSFYPGASGKFASDSLDAIYAVNAVTGALLWTYGIDGPVFGSPAVANGMVYVIDPNNVSALNATTGALIWQYDVPGQAQYCSPTVVNNILYFTDPGKNVYALNATTGALVWNYATSAANRATPGRG